MNSVGVVIVSHSPKVAEGAALTDGDILGMNWLAEGVDGAMPS